MFKKLFLLLGLASVLGVFAGDFAIHDLNLDRPDGFYRKGETIIVTGKLLKAGRPAPEYKLRAITRWESIKPVATQDFPCDGNPFEVTFKCDRPGWVYFAFQVIGPDGKVVEKPTPQVVQRLKKTHQRFIWAARQPLGNAALGALFA